MMTIKFKFNSNPIKFHEKYGVSKITWGPSNVLNLHLSGGRAHIVRIPLFYVESFTVN